MIQVSVIQFFYFFFSRSFSSNSYGYIDIQVQCILTYPNPFGQEKKIFVRISEKFGYVKYIENVLQKVLMRHEYH